MMTPIDTTPFPNSSVQLFVVAHCHIRDEATICVAEDIAQGKMIHFRPGPFWQSSWRKLACCSCCCEDDFDSSSRQSKDSESDCRGLYGCSCCSTDNDPLVGSSYFLEVDYSLLMLQSYDAFARQDGSLSVTML